MPNSSEGEGIVLENDKQEGSTRVGTSEAESERVALLKAVVACAPTEWGAEFESRDGLPPRDAICAFEGEACCLFLAGNDYWDSHGMLLMLDEMKRQGWFTSLDDYSDRWDCQTCKRGDNPGMLRSHFGPTRAWAVASAFVASCHQGIPATVEPTQPPGPEGKTEKSRGEKV